LDKVKNNNYGICPDGTKQVDAGQRVQGTAQFSYEDDIPGRDLWVIVASTSTKGTITPGIPRLQRGAPGVISV
jgi:hypothetical protein